MLAPPSGADVRAGKAPWGAPLAAIDHAWTRWETWLAIGALFAELCSMSLWVALKGLSTPAGSESHGGVIFRALLGATVLGTAAYWSLRKKPARVREGAALVAVLVAFVAAKSWAAVGVDYTSNLLNWYQQGSVLTLFGGLRGVGTRLTLLLALLGGSLATARGKHVVLDVVARFTPTRLRPALVVVGFSASALVALGAAWGFLDHIAIENFGATADSPMTGKIAAIEKGLDEDVFVLSRQLELDARSVRHVVLRGEGYADWLGGAEWNQFVESSGFPERFGAEAARGLAIPKEERRAAIVVVPGRGEPRGELIRAANLVFPIGLLVIALRFLLRGALVVSGHASVEADEEDDAIAGAATSAKGG